MPEIGDHLENIDEAMHPDWFVVYSNQAVGAEVEAKAAPGVGKRIRVMGYHVALSAAANLNLRDGSGGATLFAVPCRVASSPVTSPAMGEGVALSENTALWIIATGLANLDGTIYGRIETIHSAEL